MRVRVAICDDEEPAVERARELILAWSRLRTVPVEVASYPSGDAFLFAWNESAVFDAVFLDIKMRRTSGMAVAERVRRKDQQMAIVFITNFIDYVLHGYEVQALRYLVKPLKEVDLFSCMDRIQAAAQNRRTDTFLFQTDGRAIRMKVEEILYFEIFSHEVELHTRDGRVFCFNKRLRDLEAELPPCFVRNHRSFIVNIEHVFAAKRKALELDSSTELPLSESRRDAVNRLFLERRVL